MNGSTTVKNTALLRAQLNNMLLAFRRWIVVCRGIHILYIVVPSKQPYHEVTHDPKEHENETFDPKDYDSSKFFWAKYLYCEGRREECDSITMCAKWEQIQSLVEMTYDHTRQAIGRLCVIARHAIPQFPRLSFAMKSAYQGPA